MEPEGSVLLDQKATQQSRRKKCAIRNTQPVKRTILFLRYLNHSTLLNISKRFDP